MAIVFMVLDMLHEELEGDIHDVGVSHLDNVDSIDRVNILVLRLFASKYLGQSVLHFEGRSDSQGSFQELKIEHFFNSFDLGLSS